MWGVCEDCKRFAECHKDIGIIWGGCYSDFEPKEKKEKGAQYND